MYCLHIFHAGAEVGLDEESNPAGRSSTCPTDHWPRREVTRNTCGDGLTGYAPPPRLTANSAADHREWLTSAKLLTLDLQPASGGALGLIEHLVKEVCATEVRAGRRRRRDKERQQLSAALGAVVGGVLTRWGSDEPVPVFRSLVAQRFSSCLIGYRAFIAASDALGLLDLVNRKEGFQNIFLFDRPVWTGGKAARFWPTAKLLALAAGYGVVPTTLKSDFQRRVNTSVPKVAAPIELKSLRERGRDDRVRLTVPRTDEQANRLRDDVVAFNQFAAEHEVKGCRPPRFKRVFTACWRLGGRWIAVGEDGTYQTMAEASRVSDITINGEPVAEVDVKSSHLSIMHGLLGLTLPEGDLYEFAGVPRPVIKAWMTATLGKGSPVRRWPKRTVADVPQVSSISAIEVCQMICARYPFMSDPARAVATAARLWELADIGKLASLLTHRLMAIEAEALTGAMRALRAGVCHGGVPVLALPLHDSLIVPRSCAGAAEAVLVFAFSAHANRVRIRCDVTPPSQ